MNDYSALAQRVSISISGVRGCLMLSRDGMVLGAHPEGDAEAEIRSAWVRFTALGDPERSYVEFPDRIWAFVRRGAYSAFAVGDTGVRPGVLVDLLEQALMMGEHDRAQDRQTMWVPETPSAPSGKPRTSLHKPERAAKDTPEPPPPQRTSPRPSEIASNEPQAGGEPSEGSDAAATVVTESTGQPESATGTPSRREKTEDGSEVDRILLAKEFAGLLQLPKKDDEASR